MNVFRTTLTSLVMALAAPVLAADPIQQNNSNAVWFENWIGLSNGMMRVADPDGRITDVRANTGTPVFQLPSGEVIDGRYRYELRAVTEEMVKNTDHSRVRNSDQPRPDYVPKPFYRTGSFVVERGVILRPENAQGGDKGDKDE